MLGSCSTHASPLSTVASTLALYGSCKASKRTKCENAPRPLSCLVLSCPVPSCPVLSFLIFTGGSSWSGEVEKVLAASESSHTSQFLMVQRAYAVGSSESKVLWGTFCVYLTVCFVFVKDVSAPKLSSKKYCSTCA